MISVSVERLTYAPGGGPALLDDVTLSAAPGEVLGVLGPNGAGKSSLLRCLYGAARPSRGRIRYGTTDGVALSDRARARLIAAVPQDQPADFHLTVREVVETGRTPHARALIGGDPGGAGAVESALTRLDLVPLAERAFSTLSGGERKRALIARALAQAARAMVLDEPVNHLDIRHQLELMALVRTLGATIIVALHDFELAARFCDRLALLDRGRLIATGDPGEVLAPRRIRDVFGVCARVERDPAGPLRFFSSPLHRPTRSPR